MNSEPLQVLRLCLMSCVTRTTRARARATASTPCTPLQRGLWRYCPCMHIADITQRPSEETNIVVSKFKSKSPSQFAPSFPPRHVEHGTRYCKFRHFQTFVVLWMFGFVCCGCSRTPASASDEKSAVLGSTDTRNIWDHVSCVYSERAVTVP